MRAKREYRDREDTEVAVLDALVNRADGGMTIFELRAATAVDIDTLEDALATLKEEQLIIVESDSSEVLIKPAEEVIPDDVDVDEESFTDWIRRRMPF